MSEPRLRLDPTALSDAIRLDSNKSDADRPTIRFNLMLLVFMRIVACLWIFRGLIRWDDVLSARQEPFAASHAIMVTEAAFFCVADIVAGVGLWMATSWGGILWLVTASIGLIATLIAPHPGLLRQLAFGGDIILMVGYFVLNWYAARERDD